MNIVVNQQVAQRVQDNLAYTDDVQAAWTEFYDAVKGSMVTVDYRDAQQAFYGIAQNTGYIDAYGRYIVEG